MEKLDKWLSSHGLCLGPCEWFPNLREFKIHKGLLQGDPLSSFLFILTMEALSVTLQKAKNKKVFKEL